MSEIIKEDIPVANISVSQLLGLQKFISLIISEI